MLRYFYILLLCIEWTISYNHINDKGRKTHKSRHVKKLRDKGRDPLISQVYDYDRSPVEFDLASFIQPDEENVEDDDAYRYQNKKRKRVSNRKPIYDYSSIMGLNNDDSYKKKNYDYFNTDIGDHSSDLKLNSNIFKDSLNVKRYDLNAIDDLNGKDKYRKTYKDLQVSEQNSGHNAEKKCALKRLKFPFFSHNKSEPLLPKNKKRKLFCFNCPKKEKTTYDNEVRDDSILHYKMRKRSLEEKLCPVCRKRFISNLRHARHKKNPKNIIHNSRQFFQKRGDAKVDKDLKKLQHLEDAEKVADENYRRKRQDEDKQRQLKELEKVQAKIDKVRIIVPKFMKPEQR